MSSAEACAQRMHLLLMFGTLKQLRIMLTPFMPGMQSADDTHQPYSAQAQQLLGTCMADPAHGFETTQPHVWHYSDPDPHLCHHLQIQKGPDWCYWT